MHSPFFLFPLVSSEALLWRVAWAVQEKAKECIDLYASTCTDLYILYHMHAVQVVRASPPPPTHRHTPSPAIVGCLSDQRSINTRHKGKYHIISPFCCKRFLTCDRKIDIFCHSCVCNSLAMFFMYSLNSFMLFWLRKKQSYNHGTEMAQHPKEMRLVVLAKPIHTTEKGGLGWEWRWRPLSEACDRRRQRRQTLIPQEG